MEMIKRFFKDESGATMVEYAVLVALIAMASIGMIYILGGQINTNFANIKDCLKDAKTC